MANSKIITYDLNKSGKNYDELYAYIKSFAQWAHINQSVWFVKTNKSCVDIVGDMRNILDSDDNIFVAELSNVAAWYNILADDEYLKMHL